MSLTKEELAKKLDGYEYPARELRNFSADAKGAGLVFCYGQSDDLLEFEGAIYEEVGAWEGCTEKLDGGGLIRERCCDEDCPYDKERKEKAPHWVKAAWCPDGEGSSSGDGPAWRITASVPYAVFTIVEDDDLYCEGCVFAMADLRKPPAEQTEKLAIDAATKGEDT